MGYKPLSISMFLQRSICKPQCNSYCFTLSHDTWTGGQASLLQNTNKYGDSSLEIHRTAAMWGKGLHGALVTNADDSAIPWGSQALNKNNGTLCVRNIDITCPFFLLPPSLWISLCVYLSCSLVLSLTGREQGMLIKGCKNHKEKKKGGALGGGRGNQAPNGMCHCRSITKSM